MWTALGLIELAVAVVCAWLWLRCERAIHPLSKSGISPLERWPSVSVIVAARNEERNLEEGLRSLLSLDYPEVEITVVNDRSTDSTGAILERLSAEHPALNVVTVNDLPAGWLGKNHAMQAGADGSVGDWLLFTDADVVFRPDTLRLAIGYAVRNRVDHLSAVPRITTDSFWLKAFVPVFSMCFLLFVKAWDIRKRYRAAHVGIGAFNLVRARAYQEILGHRSLRLRPDDDLKLGKALKNAGFQPDLVQAEDLLSVEWYSSLGELVRGLEKNAFAGVDYRVRVILGSVMAVWGLFVLPFVAPFWVPWPQMLLFATAAAIYVCFAARASRTNRQPAWAGMLFPVAMLLMTYIQIRTTILNLWMGGIRWRDTFYPLNELRKNTL